MTSYLQHGHTTALLSLIQKSIVLGHSFCGPLNSVVAFTPREARHPTASSFGRTRDCQADGVQQRRRVAGGYAARVATVVTDDEPAAGCDHPSKQPAEIRLEVLQWDLVDQSVDVAEALRGLQSQALPMKK